MSKRLLFILIFLVSLLLLFGLRSKAQELNIKMQQSVYLSSVPRKPLASRLLHFPNIGKIKFYENTILASQIAALENKPHKNYELLDSLLTEYAHNFGIDNFKDKKQLEYVWKLGQVKEILRDTAAALFYYALALNHQPKDSARIRLHYDALQTNKKVSYVDRNYYYRILRERHASDTLELYQDSSLAVLTQSINSPYPDYAPVMHPSNQILIFTSRRNDYKPSTLIDYRQNEDLYYTEYTEEGWSEVIPFPPSINTRYNEGSACLNREGNILYFVRCNHPDGLGNCDIYSAELVNKEWKNVTNLGAAVNSPAWDSHPTLSPDGKTLYFASNRSSGFGGTDLYKTTRREDGTWTVAKNLGPIINTAQDEVSPFIHPLNNTLYFSSKGHITNYGGFDIFRTKMYAGNWEPPKNLGPLINTSKDEYYFSIDANADTLFYARTMDDHEQNMDIFSYPMPMAARPDAVVNFSGYLIDSASGQPIVGLITLIDLDNNTEIEPIFVGPDGYFEFQLIGSRTYQLQIQGHNALHIQEEETLPADSVLSLIDIGVKKNIPIIFESLEFLENKTELTLGIELQLDYVIDYLAKHPGLELEINVHTDSDGSPDYNLSLSRGRAESIRQYILKQTAYSPSRIKANGLGDTRPIFPNDSPENKAKNRRVEFWFILPTTTEGASEVAQELSSPKVLGKKENYASQASNSASSEVQKEKNNLTELALNNSTNAPSSSIESSSNIVSPTSIQKNDEVEKVISIPIPANEVVKNEDIKPLPKPKGWPPVDSLLEKYVSSDKMESEEEMAKEIERVLAEDKKNKITANGHGSSLSTVEDDNFEEEAIELGEDLLPVPTETEKEEEAEVSIMESEVEEVSSETSDEEEALELIESSFAASHAIEDEEMEEDPVNLEEESSELEDEIDVEEELELELENAEEGLEAADLEGLDIEGIEEDSPEENEIEDIDDMEAEDLDDEEAAPAWDDDF